MSKKKIDWNRPWSLKDSCICSGIGLGLIAISYAVMFIWFKWDDFRLTIRSMKERLTDLELWRSKKDRA